MQTPALRIICFAMGLMASIASSDAQQFTKYPFNPVFTPAGIIYEQRGIGSPAVLFRNDTFHMLYAAGSPDGKGYISYAFSTDGTNWQRYHGGVPVLLPDSTGWDSLFLDTPDFLYDDSLGQFILYYFGDSNTSPPGSAIGIATSPDLRQWSRYSGNPVLRPGNPDQWDGLFVESPSVAYAWGQYWMVYTGVDTLWRPAIGLAVSADGFQWSKFPGNPIITPSRPWESLGTATPTLLFNDSALQLWYCGASITDFAADNKIDTLHVGYAASAGGHQWHTRATPVLSSDDTPADTRGPWAPDVVFLPDSGKYFMWYETATGFGLATAQVPGTFPLSVKPLKKGIFFIKNRYLWTAQRTTFTIYSLNGTAVYTQTTRGPSFVNLGFLSAGVYVICFPTERTCFTTGIF